MVNVVVRNSAELAQALKTAKGGETIVLQNTGQEYSLNLKSFNPTSGVTIKSENPDNPVTFNTMIFERVKNVHIDSVGFDATNVDKKAWLEGTHIKSSSNIVISNSKFYGGAVGELGSPGSVNGHQGINIQSSNNVKLVNNDFTNHKVAMEVHESDKIEILGNKVTQFQEDGLRLSGNKDVLVEGNHMHDPLGAYHNVVHSDFIQMWAVRETRASENITIRGNFLDSGDGRWTQSIFMRNEDVDTGQQGIDRYFKNIVVEDNLIHNNHRHGISIGETDGVTVRNNTLLHNQASGFSAPVISVNSKALNVNISNNIVTSIDAPKDAVLNNNYIINYNLKDAPNFVGNIFMNAEGGGAKGIDAFKLVPGSEAQLAGVGSSLSKYNPNPDNVTAVYSSKSVNGSESTFVFDAGFSAAKSGKLTDKNAKFTWDFGDGTKATGMVVTHTFKDFDRQKVTLSVTTLDGKSDTFTGYLVNRDPLVLKTDFEGDTIRDLSAYNLNLNANEKFLSEGMSGNGFHITKGQSLKVDRSEGNLFSLSQFSVEFDFKKTSLTGGSGSIVTIYKSWSVVLQKDNSLTFSLTDSTGKQIKLSTAANALDDKWHKVGVSYDSIGGKAQLYIDNALVAEADAGASTKPRESWGLTVGDIFGNSANGVIDNLVITTDPIGGVVINNQKSALDAAYEFIMNIDKVNPEDFIGQKVFYATDANNSYGHMVKYDAVFAGGGDDLVRGAKVIYGEDGNDRLFGSRSGAKLFGGDGNDTLTGYEGNDVLHGGKGADIMNAGAGNDVMYFDATDRGLNGGSGRDKAVYTDEGFLDFRNTTSVLRVEELSFKNGLQNTVAIDIRDVLQSDDDVLYVTGDAGDVTQLIGKFDRVSEVTVDNEVYNKYVALHKSSPVEVLISDLLTVETL